MSLERFTNNIEILQSNKRLQGLYISNEDINSLNYKLAYLGDVSTNNLIVESHLYNNSGNYLNSIYNTPYKYYSEYKDFSFDLATLFDSLNILSGEYKISMSFLINLLGESKNPPLSLAEISPDRTEVKLVVKKSYLDSFPNIRQEVEYFKEVAGFIRSQERLNNIAVNFGRNYIFNVVNIKVDCEDDLVIYCKLYAPLLDDIALNSLCYVSLKVLEDYIENVVVRTEESGGDVTILRGPKFTDCSPLESSNETDIKNWNNLLDSDSLSASRIINSVLSGSNDVDLNLDFTDFKNFVLYGSAEERLKNYDYKLKLIEYYDSEKSNISTQPANSSSYVSNLLDTYTNRKETLISNFDKFEEFLYYSTGSLFSYDITGSISPSPKYIASNKLVNYSVTSSQYTSWYTSLIEDAKEYDRTNYSSFYFNTPDHILRDPNNSQYILFIHMVGQHFDNIYNFIRKLTDIHRRDEHPERGIPNELLPYYIRSLGWKIQNTKSLSDLWLYKLGVDASGSLGTPVGELASKSHQSLSEQVWRRIVNNLPYLLKTKGSTRSIRALFSIYGIPFTLISVKEYGGPEVDEENPPILAEDKFQYLLNLDGDQYIEIPRLLVTSSFDDTVQIPQTTEFRFRTDYKSAPSMSLWAIEESGSRNNILHNLEIVKYTSSLYGQDTYGYLRYSGSSFESTSSLLPLYDNDIWTVRMYSDYPIYSGSLFTGKLNIDVAKSSDFVENRVSLSSSFYVSSSVNDMLYSLGATSSIEPFGHTVVFGGTTGSNSTRFSGSVQSYREYFGSFSKKVFEQHVLNPSSYHSTAFSSSYDQLYRYYPLGVDNLRFDHSIKTELSSSQPNQIFYGRNTAQMVNFSGSQSQQYTAKTETHYRYYPSLGANNPKSNKIRLESSKLVRQLSPDRRAEVSRYDKEQKDSNRLAVVFSPTDQINKDISNQFGSYNFENFIGDPEHGTLTTYPDLRAANEEYFKKFTKANDIGKFIEVFSLYDYSVFEQIKQLVPARANLVTGVLVEPSILERSKIKRTFPEINVLQKETVLPSSRPEFTPRYIDIPQGILELPIELEVERSKELAVIEPSLGLEVDREKMVSEFSTNIEVEVERSKNVGQESLLTLSFDNNNTGVKNYTGEISTTDNYEISGDSSLFIDSFGKATTVRGDVVTVKKDIIENGQIVRQPFSNGDVVTTTETFTYKRDGQTYTVTITDDKFVPFTAEAQSLKRNIDTNNYLDIEKYGVGSFYVYSSSVEVNFDINQLTNDNYIFYFTTIEPDISVVTELSASSFQEFLNTYNYNVYTGKNVIYKNLDLGSVVGTYHITGSRIYDNVKKYNYFYSSSGEFIQGQTSPNMLKSPVYLSNRTGSKSDYIRELDYAINKEYKAFYSSSLEYANYQHFTDGSIARSRFEGSKLVGPAINVDSPNTVTGRPVVTVTILNENDIIVQ